MESERPETTPGDYTTTTDFVTVEACRLWNLNFLIVLLSKTAFMSTGESGQRGAGSQDIAKRALSLYQLLTKSHTPAAWELLTTIWTSFALYGASEFRPDSRRSGCFATPSSCDWLTRPPLARLLNTKPVISERPSPCRNWWTAFDRVGKLFLLRPSCTISSGLQLQHLHQVRRLTYTLLPL